MKKSLTSLAALIAICGIFATGHFVMLRRIYASYRPPAGATIQEFPADDVVAKVLRINVKSDSYFMVTRKMAKTSWMALPSGPAVYVFDGQTGVLFDWTADSGDAAKFQQMWGDTKGEPVTLDQARAVCSVQKMVVAPVE